MFCPRVRAARGSHYCSNCLWPTQSAFLAPGVWWFLPAGEAGRLLGLPGLLGLLGLALLGRDPPLLAIRTTGALGPLGHYWTVTGPLPARRPWPSRAATQEHRPQPSTTVHSTNLDRSGFETAAGFKTAARSPPSRYESDAMFHLS